MYTEKNEIFWNEDRRNLKKKIKSNPVQIKNYILKENWTIHKNKEKIWQLDNL